MYSPTKTIFRTFAVELYITHVCMEIMNLMGPYNLNKAIRDGRPRPPRHQGFIAISYGGSELRHRSILETITHRPKCQIQ